MKKLFYIILIFVCLIGCGCESPVVRQRSVKKSNKNQDAPKAQPDASKAQPDANKPQPEISIDAPFVILNSKPTDTYLDFAWKAIPGAVKYKLLRKITHYIHYNTSLKKHYKSNSKWQSAYELYNWSTNTFTAVEIAATDGKEVYQYKYHLHADNNNFKVPSRKPYSKHQYKVEGFDAQNKKVTTSKDQNGGLFSWLLSTDHDDPYILKDIYTIPENALFALKDIDQTLKKSVIEIGASLYKLPANTMKTEKGGSINISGKGPDGGTYTVTKGTNSNSVELKWENYDVFGSIQISGTLTGTIGTWKSEHDTTKKSTWKFTLKKDLAMGTLKDREEIGHLMTLNGSLNITGLYTATVKFDDIAVVDIPGYQVNLPLHIEKMDNTKPRKITITYSMNNGSSETVELPHNGQLNFQEFGPNSGGPINDLEMQSLDIYSIYLNYLKK